MLKSVRVIPLIFIAALFALKSTGNTHFTAPAMAPVRGVTGDLWADTIIGERDFSQIFSGVAPNKLMVPHGVVIDRLKTPAANFEKIYVYDSGHSRILGYNWDQLSSSTSYALNATAQIVIGQPDMYSGGSNRDSGFQNWPNRPAATAATLAGMMDGQISPTEGGSGCSMDVDSQGNLYVFDAWNNRVLKYNKPFERTGEITADDVWGQNDFTGQQSNKGMSAPDATSLSYSWGRANNWTAGVDIDASGNMWVADNNNNRVLRFPAGSKTANLVLGQANFTSNGYVNVDTDGQNGVDSQEIQQSLNRFNSPTVVRVNSQGWVYVADEGNFRVLRFKPPFTNGMSGEVFGSGFRRPTGIDCDPTEPGRVWICNAWEKVIELWDETSNTKIRELGTRGDGNVMHDATGSIGVDSQGNVVVGTGRSGINANNVLVYKKNSSALTPTHLFVDNSNTSNSSISALGGQVCGVAVADNQLIVHDWGRVLFWNNPASLTTFKAPDGYISGFSNITINSFFSYDPAVGEGTIKADKNHHLWVSTVKNAAYPARILVYNLPLVTGATPIKILGGGANQSSTFNVLGGGTITLCTKIWGIAPTDAGDFLWVTDSDFNRVIRIRNPLSNNPLVDVILGQKDINGTPDIPVSNPEPGQQTTNLANRNNSTADATTLGYPGLLAIDRLGNLYVSDHSLEIRGNKRLLVYDKNLFPTNNTSVIFAPAATKIFPNIATWEPAFNSQNRMFVGYNPYHTPNPAGGYFPAFYNDPLGPSTEPNAMVNDFHSHGYAAAFDDSDNLYLTDLNRARVLIYKNPSTISLAAPTVTGPTGNSGVPGTLYSFTASFAGTDYLNVHYTFDWGDGTTTSSGWLVKGSSATYSHSWSASGFYTVRVKVNDSQWFTMTMTVIANNVDLIVSDSWIPQQIEQGKTLTLLDAISNTGGASPSFTVSYNISSATLPSTQLGTRTVSNLANSTDFKAVQMTIPSTLADGSYTITITVDSGNIIPETNETNNTLTRTINVTRPFKYDFNGDNAVSGTDGFAVMSAFGQTVGNLTFDPKYDVTGDGAVSGNDFLAVLSAFGQNPTEPYATLAVNTPYAATNSPVTFTYGHKESEVTVTSYSLDYTSDGIYDFTASTPGTVNFTYSTAGTFTAKLKVTDSTGQQAFATATVNIVNFSTAAATLTATKDTTYGSVSLSWTGSSAPYWRVYRNTNGGTYNILANVNTTSYTDNGVTTGNSYNYYVVGSKDSTGTVLGTNSATNSVTISLTSPTLTIGNTTSTSVALSWTPTPTGKVSVERSLDGLAFREIGVTATAGATSYMDTLVAPGVSYQYRIRFTDGTGKYGAYTVVKSAITTSISISLSRVQNANNIVLNWSPAPGSGVQVAVEKSTNGGTTYNSLATVTGTSYTDQVVLPTKTYSYKVRYTDTKGGYSTYSNVTSGVPTGVNPVISVSNMTDSSAAKISWSPANTTSVTVEIEKSSNGGTTFSSIATTTGTSYIDSSVTAGAGYIYRIRWSAGGLYTSYSTSGTWTSPASATTPVLSASGFESVSGTGLSWNLVPNPSLYPNASIEMKDPTQTSYGVIATTSQVASINGGLTAGTSYSYRMRFMNSGSTGAGAYSSEVTRMTPVPVISATASTGSVTLTITGTTSPYFMVYRSTDGVNFNYVGWTKTTSFTDSGLLNGTYYYYVKSWNQGQPSTAVSLVAQ